MDQGKLRYRIVGGVVLLAVLLVGIVIGWILGSRAAADAYAAQCKMK
mgnify:CR=1 FL=1